MRLPPGRAKQLKPAVTCSASGPPTEAGAAAWEAACGRQSCRRTGSLLPPAAEGTATELPGAFGDAHGESFTLGDTAASLRGRGWAHNRWGVKSLCKTTIAVEGDEAGARGTAAGVPEGAEMLETALLVPPIVVRRAPREGLQLAAAPPSAPPAKGKHGSTAALRAKMLRVTKPST